MRLDSYVCLSAAILFTTTIIAHLRHQPIHTYTRAHARAHKHHARPQITVPNEIDAYRINCVIAGVWWFITAWPSILFVRRRPGPPLPEGTRLYALHSVHEFKVTLGRLWQLRSTFKWTMCYFVYSDSVAVLGGTAILFANTEVDWGCIPKVVGIAVLVIGTPLIAIVGLVVTEWQARVRGWGPKWIIIVSLLVLAIIPVYGLVGLASDDAGLHTGYLHPIMLVNSESMT